MLLFPSPTRSDQAETRVLAAGAVWAAPRAEVLEVLCRSGSIWVTAGTEDVVLEAGERQIFRGPFRVVVQALAAAELRVRRV